MNDDWWRMDVRRCTGISSRMQTLRSFDDQSTGGSITEDGDTLGPFVTNHAAIVVPKDKVRYYAVLSNVARQFQSAAALHVLFRSTFDFRSSLCTFIIFFFQPINYSIIQTLFLLTITIKRVLTFISRRKNIQSRLSMNKLMCDAYY